MPNTRARIGKAQDTTSQSVAVFRRGAFFALRCWQRLRRPNQDDTQDGCFVR